MTHYKLSKKVITSVFAKNTYKLLIITFSFYLSFSAQAFTATAEAPAGVENFQAASTEDAEGDSEKIKEKLQVLQEQYHDARVEKIRAYYAQNNLPLQHEAEYFVKYADEYGIDWRLVAAIGFIESTGGKHACKTASYSAFGWGSCKISFDSYEHSINVISKNLGGHNPKTAYSYAGKNTKGILQAYNPPSVVPDYAKKVMDQMEIIDAQ